MINLATKYSSKVQERFYQESLTQDSFSKDLDTEFTGVKTVKVSEVGTSPMHDYTRSGSNRYGSPEELQDSVQEFVMTKDRSFTFTIDKGNNMEQNMIKKAGAAMSRQLREVVTPEIDKYRFQVWSQNAGQGAALAAPTKDTVFGMLVDAKAAMDNKLVPQKGRILYSSVTFYKVLIQCSEYLAIEKLGAKAISKGKVGEILGMDVKMIPDSYLPANVYFMIIMKDAAISPVKLHEYNLHKDPPGISGHLAEGRFIYDAFVKGTKMDGIYVGVTTGNKVADPTISVTSGTATLACTTSGATIWYTTDGSDPRYSTSRLSGTSVASVTGKLLRCVAMKDGMVMSGVVEKQN